MEQSQEYLQNIVAEAESVMCDDIDAVNDFDDVLECVACGAYRIGQLSLKLLMLLDVCSVSVETGKEQ